MVPCSSTSQKSNFLRWIKFHYWKSEIKDQILLSPFLQGRKKYYAVMPIKAGTLLIVCNKKVGDRCQAELSSLVNEGIKFNLITF